MFNNIGKKIKGLAKLVCWIGIIIFAIVGLGVIISGISGDNAVSAIISGILIIVGGFLVSWIGSFVMYGYGELIDKTADIAENTKK